MARDITPQCTDCAVWAKMQSYRKRLRRQLLSDIYQMQEVRGDSFEALGDYYGYDFQPPALNLLVFRLIPKHRDISPAQELAAKQHTMDFLEEKMLPFFQEGELCITREFILCLVNFTLPLGSPDSIQISRHVGRCFEQLCQDPKLFPFHIVMGDGIATDTAAGLSDCFHSAVTAIQHGIVHGYDRRYDSNMLKNRQVREASLSPAQLSTLQTGLVSRDFSLLSDWVRQIFREFQPQFSEIPALAFLLPRNIMQNAAILVKGKPGEALIASAGDRLALCVTLEQEQQVVLDIFQQYCLLDRKIISPGVAKVQRYLSVHYRQPASLETLGRMAELNPQYLSVRFRKETGETISQYIGRLRLNLALELLEITTLPIAQIASRVGYHDPRYFSRVFQKAFGQTPSAFRHRKSERGSVF